jgi:K+-transporting ATPase ATPase C chain
MKNEIRPAAVVLGLLTLITGFAYPLLVTGAAAAFFPREARGSLVERNGRIVGSALIGQQFSDPRYFWGRPSATAQVPYNAAASGGSNLGPSNAAFLDAVKSRVVALRSAHPAGSGPIPMDLVTTSASGLDPHISPAAAAYQIRRVAEARGISAGVVEKLVARHSEGRQLGILGEPRVNVLLLNIALDELR